MPWEETQDYIRSGHRDAGEFESDSLQTIWISEEEQGIKAAIEKPKGATMTILYPEISREGRLRQTRHHQGEVTLGDHGKGKTILESAFQEFR